MSENTDMPFFTLTFDYLGEPIVIRFSDAADLRKWQVELDRFNRNYSTFPGDTVGVDEQTVRRVAATTDRYLKELAQALSEKAISADRSGAETNASAVMTTSKLIVPDSEAGWVLIRLGKHDAKAAFFAFALIQGAEFVALQRTQNNMPLLPTSVAMAIGAVSLLRLGYGSTVSESQARLNASLEGAEKASLEISKLDDQARALINAFDARMKTDKAFEYWTNKERQHKAASDSHKANLVTFSKATICVLAAAFIFLLIFTWNVPIAAAPTWVPVGFGVLLIGVVWIGRVLVRLYLGQLALKEDAAERAVMVQTFVALVKEQAAKPEHLNFVLQALFRSAVKAQDGEDGAPPMPTEILIKRVIGGEKTSS